MNIYEYAMKMEKDGEAYYRELAGKTVNKGLKNIFTMLADAEVVHYDIFRKMRDDGQASVGGTEILSGVKNVFEKMWEEKDTNVDISEIELYKKAQEIEKLSKDFYLKQAEEVKDAAQKDIFLKIAEEEKMHFFILERITDFVSRPLTWLENPEWYHLEEY